MHLDMSALCFIPRHTHCARSHTVSDERVLHRPTLPSVRPRCGSQSALSTRRQDEQARRLLHAWVWWRLMARQALQGWRLSSTRFRGSICESPSCFGPSCAGCNVKWYTQTRTLSPARQPIIHPCTPHKSMHSHAFCAPTCLNKLTCTHKHSP